jgi:branched-chain amino acid transport system permease protein
LPWRFSPGQRFAGDLVNRFGVPFLLNLPLRFVTAALAPSSARSMCMLRPQPLDQVLFNGHIFMSVAAVDYVMGSSQQFIIVPQALQASSMSSASARANTGC